MKLGSALIAVLGIIGLGSIHGTFACSELGKIEFKLDPKLANQCALKSQDIAYEIAAISYPKLSKGETEESRPSPPFMKRGLDTRSSNHESKPSDALLNKRNGNKTATFPTTVSTERGKWECLYCVTFKIVHDQCEFESAALDHCAGGVEYPK